MIKVRIRDDWCEERTLVYAELNGKRTTFELCRGQDAWRNVPEEVAISLDLKKFEIQNVKDLKKKVIEPLIEKEEVKTKKEKSKKSKTLLARIKEVTEDLLDDGKLNHSNNESKKRPGRKKKKR